MEYKVSEILYKFSKLQKIELPNDFSFFCTAPSEETSKGKFLFRLRSLEYLKDLLAHEWNVAGVVCNFKVAEEVSKYFPIIITDSPERLFWFIHNSMYQRYITPSVYGEECEVSEKSSISPFGVTIGSNAVIEEFVAIREGVTIGNNCIIRAGCIIGGEGFQHFRDANGVISIRHLGGVEIGDNVEIQYLSCVDKALFKHMNTIIGDGCRIDNLVQVGHAAHIHKNVFAASGSVIGGYVEINDGCFIGMNSAIRQHVKIGHECLIGMNSAVIKNAGDGETIAGFPARTITQK